VSAKNRIISFYWAIALFRVMNIPSFLLEETINVVYRHLSYMLYNKVHVIQYIENSVDTIPPDHITDDSLYFENFHQIVAELQQYPSHLWTSLLEEAFCKLSSSRTQFTTQITQMYFEHFNPTNAAGPNDLMYKRSWPDWHVKFLNISEITRNIQTDVEARSVFYKNDPLLSYNRCPCQKCKVDWNINHKKLIYRSNSTEKLADYL
jgi:hypothetical protein